MPSFLAFIVATLFSWLVYGTLPKAGGPLLAGLLASLLWTVCFYFVRRWVEELRPDV